LISSDESFRHSVLGIVKQASTQCRLVLDLQYSAEEVDRVRAGKILQAEPRVVFLDLGKDPSGLKGIQILNQEAPDLALIVAGPELSADGILSVIRAGATEYLPRPFSREEVQEAFLRVRRRSRASSADVHTMPGRVSTVFSAKGGTGVTTVATNLAIALHRLTGRQTILLDLAPSLGTAAVALGIEPRYTYLDLIQNFHRVDEELFRSFLETHESGIHLLASPASPADTVVPSRDEIHGLLRLCQKYFDYVVIDGGNTISNHLHAILHESQDRLLVATPEVPALRNLKRAMDVFERTNGKVSPRLILNQYREGLGLSSKDVEEGLGHQLAAVLERDDAGIMSSINMGRPDVVVGKSNFAKTLMQLGTELAGSEFVIPPRKTFLRRLLGGAKSTGRNGKEST